MEFTTSNILITPASPALPYRRRKLEDKTRNKWGQLKLLMTEVQFFTQYWDPKTVPNPVVVYAGAASGIHIPFLSSLFPTFTFHLYDPAKFDIQPTDKIFIYNEYFTDDVARQWSGRKDVFFVSDIRTVGWEKPDLTEEDIEEGVIRDMCWQQEWHDIIRPVKSHLKFRLPYTLSDTVTNLEYLYGHVYIQPWTGPSSTETRLVPDGHKRIVWDSVRYEQQNFFHNVIVRPNYKFKNPFTNTLVPIYSNQLLNDYDSRLTSQIIIDYLNRFGVCNYTNFKKWLDDAIAALDWTRSGKNITTIRQNAVKIFGADTPLMKKDYLMYRKANAIVELLNKNRIPHYDILYDLMVYPDRHIMTLEQYRKIFPALPVDEIVKILSMPNMLKDDKPAVISTDASKEASIQYRDTRFNVPVYFISEMKERNIAKDMQVPVYYRYFSFLSDFWKLNVNREIHQLLENQGVNIEVFASPFQKMFPQAYGLFPEDRAFGMDYVPMGEEWNLETGAYLIHMHDSVYVTQMMEWVKHQMAGKKGITLFVLGNNNLDFGEYERMKLALSPGKYTMWDNYRMEKVKPNRHMAFYVVSNNDAVWSKVERETWTRAFY